MANYTYEITTDKTKSTNVIFDGNRFERIDSSDRVNHSVRVLKDGKIAVASGSKPNSEAALIEQALGTVQYGSPHDVPFVGRADITPLALTDSRAMSSKEMIEVMGGFVADLRKLDDKLVVGASLSSNIMETHMKTSDGFDAGYNKTMWRAGASIELMINDDLVAIWDGKGAMGPDIDIPSFTETLAQKLEYARNVVDFKPGSYPVIFVPGEVGYITNPIVACLNGQAVYRKVSPWGDKLGQKLLDERVNIVDDGAISAYPCRPFDVEGTPTRRNVLVESGIIKNLLTNRKVGAQLGIGSSGNASGMGINTHFLHLNAGSKPLAELIAGIDYGMIIESSMGAWSGNPYGGIVSGTIATAFKIEKGKITGRVKNCMFTVNAFDHFNRHVVDFSVERETYGGTCFPYVLLNDVVISTK
ncbi:MAG: TldD/PmbA family protein [Defluviitaleaceae bacterium]|nr:TldD/PmbA family protein [Defluviitaleaceae bacterium]